MTEREEILEVLEHCAICNDAQDCPDCPFLRECGCQDLFKDRIKKLLKAQEPIAPNHVEDGNNENCGIVNHWFMCGKCGSCIDPGDKYCRECGQAVKWE